jgi:tryprostatin B 6-hydroxylase
MSLFVKFACGGAIGVAAHLSLFIRGEWHMEAPSVLAIHCFLAFVAQLFELSKLQSVQVALVKGSMPIMGYLLGLFSSICMYRLSSLHPLHRFPGPGLAPLSKIWHVWQCRFSRNHTLMERLQNEYKSDFVRIGSHTLSENFPLKLCEADICISLYRTK